jgi:hypothetical protein
MVRGIKVFERPIGLSAEPGVNIEEYHGSAYYSGTLVLAIGTKLG